MKYNEFHRLVKQRGWCAYRQKGSHVVYERNGEKITIPNHGSKEMPEGLRLALAKRMGL